MKVDKLSVSFDPDLGDAVRAAARQRGGGVSRWLPDAISPPAFRIPALLSQVLDDRRARTDRRPRTRPFPSDLLLTAFRCIAALLRGTESATGECSSALVRSSGRG
jgi:hypothetical protein